MKRGWLFRSILTLYLIGVAVAGASAQAPRYALVIGNSNYNELGRLKNPGNDATDMAEALKTIGFEVTLLKDADLLALDDAVVDFKNVLSQRADSIGFFYYAGHGVQSQGLNYLIPTDARIPSESYLKIRAVALQTILENIQESRNALNLVVLDACRDNPFSWARSGMRGLSVIGGQPTGSIIVYSTGAGSVAKDGEGRNGVFTAELLKHIKTPGLEVSEVFKLTGKAVSSVTNGTQVPAIYSQHFDSAYLAGVPEKTQQAQTIPVQATPPVLPESKSPDPGTMTAATPEPKTAVVTESVPAVQQLPPKERAAFIRKEIASIKADTLKKQRAGDRIEDYLALIKVYTDALDAIAERFTQLEQVNKAVLEEAQANKLAEIDALTIHPWESNREFEERKVTQRSQAMATFNGERSQKASELSAERNAAEKEILASQARVNNEFTAKSWILSGKDVAIEVGEFDREEKSWAIKLSSKDARVPFEDRLIYSIKGSKDIGTAYMEFDALRKEGRLGGEIQYGYEARPGKDIVYLVVTSSRIVQLTTKRIIVNKADRKMVSAFKASNTSFALAPPRVTITSNPPNSILMDETGSIIGDTPQVLDPGIGKRIYTVSWKEYPYSSTVLEHEFDYGDLLTLTVTPPPFMEMVEVEGGLFKMGSGEMGVFDEKPQHDVILTSFLIGKYEVTQYQYNEIKGYLGLQLDRDVMQLPIEELPFNEIIEFCNMLSEKEGYKKVYSIDGTSVTADFSANGYRLPTEAEWEYAAMGGKKSKNYFYAGSNSIGEVAWYSNNSNYKLSVVGKKMPNELGLYDMNGNVAELCWDYYANDYYKQSERVDPIGPARGENRVVRGGRITDSSTAMTVKYRSNTLGHTGFRVVRRP